jgi:alkyl hydroperoxide reductase subunit F
MIDQELKDQLKQVLSSLESEIVLRYNESTHADQKQLLDLLQSVAETSPRVVVKSSTSHSPIPAFHLEVSGKASGICFQGIPGGHEFSSLVLAILNSDKKGKLPDEAIQQRIRRIQGPVRIKTYISLTCENCPDVVQALNLMATIHPDFEHTMVDGQYTENEIASLNIQGVPSVVIDGKLIHSGRIALIDLIAKLESALGSKPTEYKEVELGHFDVAVVGGGPAGASAAIYTARKGLKTALIAEKFGGQVQETKGIENLISVPYTEGPELSAKLAEHVAAYPVTKLEHRRVKRVIPGAPHRLELESGEKLSAETLIITTGAKWRELGVPGEKEYLGRGVAFCPHCDGPYYKGKKVAVVGGGNSGVEAAIDLAGIVRDVVLFEYNDALKADQILIDKARSLPNVSIVTSAKTTQVLGDGERVTGLQYQDRKTEKLEHLELDGVFVQIGLLPNSSFLKGVVELTPFGEVVVDPKGRTSVAGIYAAGDVTTTPYKQIIISMGEGAKAALAAFEDRMKKGA